MKRLLVALLLCGCGSGPGTPAVPGTVTGPIPAIVNTNTTAPLTIYATNQSPMPDTRFQQIVSDLQLQLDRDFTPVWHIGGKIVVSNYNPNVIGFVVSSTQTFPTYQNKPVHSYSLYNTAWDNYNLTQQDDPTGAEDSANCSHELLQRLCLNAGVNSSVGITDCCGGNGYSPVNSSIGNEGYGPQTLSDFAFPSFLVPGAPAPYDFDEQLKAPLTGINGQLIYIATSP